MFNSLEGRSVIVTGGSKGIGEGIAKRFGEIGAKVLVVSRKAAEAEAVAAAIVAAGGTAKGFAADVSVAADAKAMAAAAIEAHGGIDILCANAGIYPVGNLDTLSEEAFDHVLDVNLKGSFLSVSACLPAMKQKRRGRIILTSSITGPFTGIPGLTHYSASKAGQLGFMRAAAVELAPWGITVNSVLPGSIMTEGLAGLGPETVGKMEASIPMRHLGTPADIANAALYFATDEAAFVTAQALVIDGGQIVVEGGLMADPV